MSTEEPAGRSPSGAVPGPIDRESFFAAQARHRRASHLYALGAALAIAVLGVPLSAVVSPLLFGFLGLGADLLNLIVPAPDLLGGFLRGLEAVDHLELLPPTPAGLARIAVFLAPGALFLLASWCGVRAAFARTGVGGLLLALGARPPRPGDLEEVQLGNVCEEMAIAAGVPPPRVMLLDLSGVYAAAVGSRRADATIVVSRGLLDRCDRDETAGLIGHLIASVGHGDLGIAAAILSLFQTLGLATALLSAPFGPASRRAIWRFLRFALRGGRGIAEGETVTELLTADENEDLDRFSKDGKTRLRDFFRLPFLLAWMAFWLNQKVFEMLVLGPLLAFGWRFT